ncbi:hypothetical protein JVU11DRAFT_9468 [Chiua virens]|nr:hypothetical protein JVU11DRAFT_9468 [Chiua virens]
MEVLQMLKFWLKKDWLNFTKDWVMSQREMLIDEDSIDLLAGLFSSGNGSSLDEVLTTIARAEGDGIPNVTNIYT